MQLFLLLTFRLAIKLLNNVLNQTAGSLKSRSKQRRNAL